MINAFSILRSSSIRGTYSSPRICCSGKLSKASSISSGVSLLKLIVLTNLIFSLELYLFLIPVIEMESISISMLKSSRSLMRSSKSIGIILSSKNGPSNSFFNFPPSNLKGPLGGNVMMRVSGASFFRGVMQRRPFANFGVKISRGPTNCNDAASSIYTGATFLSRSTNKAYGFDDSEFFKSYNGCKRSLFLSTNAFSEISANAVALRESNSIGENVRHFAKTFFACKLQHIYMKYARNSACLGSPEKDSQSTFNVYGVELPKPRKTILNSSSYLMNSLILL